MSKLKFDEVGQRLFETGISNVAVFPYQSKDKKYGKGVAWNGVTNLNITSDGGEPTDLWADNLKYLSLYSTENVNAAITAYMYPDEVATLDGTAEPVKGVRIGQQKRGMFALVAKTLIGNDVDDTDYGYKLHFIYGAKMSPSEKSYETVNDSPSANELSWDINTTPVNVEGYKPCAHLEIDSTKVDADKLAALEAKVYGSDDADAEVLMPEEIFALLGEGEEEQAAG